MKKLLFILSAIFLFSVSCNSVEKRIEKKFEKETGVSLEEATEEITGKEYEKIKDCDEFLKKYEAWVDKYLEVLEAYVNKPTQETISDFMEMAPEAMTWATQWSAMYDCANDEKYEKEFDRIEEKVDKKTKELGMD